MMTLENTVKKFLAIVLNISWLAQAEFCTQKPVAANHSFFFWSSRPADGSFVPLIFLDDDMADTPVNVYISTKEISERNKHAKNESA